MADFPKIRYIEAVPTTLNKQQVIALRDPLQISENVVIISPLTLYLLNFFDGKYSLEDMQNKFKEQFKQEISIEKLNEIITELDKNYFLLNERFLQYKEAKEKLFYDNPIRNGVCSGKVYPRTKEKCINFLNKKLNKINNITDNNNYDIKGVIAPHIDYARGGITYPLLYRNLKNKKYDLIIILGTSHFQTKNNLLTLTKKDFLTPLGMAKTNKNLVEYLIKDVQYDLFDDEIAHQNEHSIELQILWLQHILNNPEINILPVLCGSFENFYNNNSLPQESNLLQSFFNSLKNYLKENNLKTLLVAGVDLSHMGTNFGQQYLDLLNLQFMIRKDLKNLKAIEKLNVEKFYEEIAKEKNNRNICGLSSIYCFLNLIELANSKLIHYNKWYDIFSGSTVSFAGMIFY